MLPSFLGNLVGVLASLGCYGMCSLFCFRCVVSLRSVSLIGLLRRFPLRPLCVLRHVLEVFLVFALICGGEVRSLGEVGGLVPLRLLRTPSEALHASASVGD